jgi:hypothetical protein
MIYLYSVRILSVLRKTKRTKEGNLVVKNWPWLARVIFRGEGVGRPERKGLSGVQGLKMAANAHAVSGCAVVSRNGKYRVIYPYFAL